MPVVATLAHVRSIAHVPRFIQMSSRCVMAAEGTDGNLGVLIKPNSPQTWRTLTGWEDEAAMLTFVHCPVHGTVMPLIGEYTDRSRFARFRTDEPFGPALWEQAVAETIDGHTAHPVTEGYERPA